MSSAKNDLQKSKEEQLISDSESVKYKETKLKNEIQSIQETELRNEIQPTKVNHIFPLLLLVLAAGIFIVLSSSGEQSDSKRKSYLNNTTANSINTAESRIKHTKMLEKGLSASIN